MGDLAAIDLNLLRALGHLLDAASVSGAARRAGIGQPAMSRKLAQLRRLLRDPLLVPLGRRSVLSEHAAGLRPRVHDALAAIDLALRTPSAFDAKLARFEVRIAANDYVGAALLGPWIASARKEAPGLGLQIEPISTSSVDALSAGELDFVIGPAVHAPKLELDRFVGRPLWTDRYVCAMRAGHPATRGRLQVAKFLDLEHVVVRCSEFGGYEAALAQRSLKLQAAHVAPSFLLALSWLEHSDRVATLPARLVALAGPRFRAHPLPFPLAAFTIHLAWHPRSTPNAGHRWLRHSLLAYARGNSQAPAHGLARESSTLTSKSTARATGG